MLWLRWRTVHGTPTLSDAALTAPCDPGTAQIGSHVTRPAVGAVASRTAPAGQIGPCLSAACPAVPGLPALVLRRVTLSLTVACAIPAALFLTSYELSGVWTAIIVALFWSYGAIAWRAVTGRRTSGLLVLTAIVLTGRTVIALVAQSTFFYFLQPIITDGVVAAAFLLSLATARPMVARLAGDFYPMDAELSLRPRLRKLFWHLTAMWAVVCLAKAVAMFWALNSALARHLRAGQEHLDAGVRTSSPWPSPSAPPSWSRARRD